ncbi:MAG: hypothetical protein GY910_24385 [bacterium]|nr:hypothetical protein [Deltaproteobacteria bacterium]MCP4908122.1 hypothetical protein [bacterium]
MRILIVEDDFVSSARVTALVAPSGPAEIAVDGNNVMKSFNNMAEGYLAKPLEKDRLFEQLTQLGLI